jgi:transposase
MCSSGVRWCARADAIFDVAGMHVLDVEVDDRQRLVLTVESGQVEAACPRCGVMAIGTAAESGCCMTRRASAESRCCDG